MAFKIQTNLDLCNFELQNFCVQSYTNTNNVEPTLARMLFVNGNENSDFSDRLVIYNSTGWKGFAYMEDINAITNGEGSLGERVVALENMLGLTDVTDVIDTWEDVKNFFEGVSEGLDLMTMLAGKADKTDLANYLPLTGGTITGGLTVERNHYRPLIVNNTTDGETTILFQRKGSSLGFLGFSELNVPMFMSTMGAMHPLIHLGNVGDYAIKIDGSNEMQGNLSMGSKGILFTITEGGNRGQLGAIDNNIHWYDGTEWNVLGYKSDIDKVLAIAESALAKDSFDRIYADAIDSDVVSATTMYADTFTGNATSATKLANSVSLWGNTFDGTQSLSGDITIANNNSILFYDKSSNKFNALLLSNGNVFAIGYDGATFRGYETKVYGGQITFITGEASATPTTAMTITNKGNVSVGTYFLDGAKFSVAGGIAAIDVTGVNVTLNSIPTRGLVLGGVAHTLSQYLRSDGTFAIQSYHKADSTALALNLNPLGGRVSVGTGGLNVAGGITVLENVKITTAKVYNSQFARGYLWEGTNGDIGGIYAFGFDGNALDYINITTGSFDSTNGICLKNSGNVGIGTISPEYKLDVNGTARFSGLATLNGGAYIPTGKTLQFGTNGPTMEYEESTGAIKVTGNIYATGTVASGNVGDIGSGGGGGNASVQVIEVPIGVTSYNCTHTLDTKDVIVQIFEENSSGEINMILTDVEIVDASTIQVLFGRATTLRHRVHIIG